MDADPYKTPIAELENGVQFLRRSVWWKVYFWIVLVVQVTYAGWIIADPDSLDANEWDYLGLFIYIPVMLAIFGFVYIRPFLTRSFWQYFFIFMVIWDLWYSLLLEDWSDVLEQGVLVLVLTMGLILLFTIPQYVAIFKYGYRDKELWNVNGI